jgi:2-C-methyl-D-erythritol 4-phosphate cytidylyltransferase
VQDRDVTARLDLRGDVAVLIPAAGLGVRLGPGGPKALRLLSGDPLLVHAVRRVAAADGVAPVTVVAGGVTRQASVAAALAAVPASFEIILVHDAARALTPPALVAQVAGAVRAGHDAVIPVLPLVDTIKEVSASGAVVGTVDRAVLRAVQTPQGFRRAVLAAAHNAAVDEHTDDAGMVEKLGGQVFCVPGDELALKITRPVDLVIAEALLARTLAG